MEIEYGPPGHTGVTQLQYVGDVSGGDGDIRRFAKPVGVVAALLWVLGPKQHRKTARNVAIGSLLIGLIQ